MQIQVNAKTDSYCTQEPETSSKMAMHRQVLKKN